MIRGSVVVKIIGFFGPTNATNVKIIKIYLLRRPRLDILDNFVVLLLATSRSMVKSAEASILLLTDPHCLGQAGL